MVQYKNKIHFVNAIHYVYVVDIFWMLFRSVKGSYS